MAEGTNRTNNDVVAELAQKAAADVHTIIFEGKDGPAEVIVLPQHMRAESIKKYLDEYRTAPERKKGQATLVDLNSFIDHVNRNKDASSAMFGVPDAQNPRLLCVFNYNEPALVNEAIKATTADAGTLARPGAPRFGDHRAVYTFPLADEWKAWTAADGESMAQEAFAIFLEERLIDVADPVTALAGAQQFAEKLAVTFATPQKLLELSRGLAVRVNGRVKQNVKLQSGEAQIAFSEEHTDETGAPLTIPGAFVIQVPVFKNGAPYQIPARLRYRVSGGAIAWWFDLYRTDRVFDHAFEEACGTAKSSTSLPLFKGTPEQ
jgi:uncharacterized protein YfdQ (DUF2303 family)